MFRKAFAFSGELTGESSTSVSQCTLAKGLSDGYFCGTYHGIGDARSDALSHFNLIGRPGLGLHVRMEVSGRSSLQLRLGIIIPAFFSDGLLSNHYPALHRSIFSTRSDLVLQES